MGHTREPREPDEGRVDTTRPTRAKRQQMGRNQASTRHVRHVEKGQMLVSTRGPRVEALSQVGHLSGRKVLLQYFTAFAGIACCVRWAVAAFHRSISIWRFTLEPQRQTCCLVLSSPTL